MTGSIRKRRQPVKFAYSWRSSSSSLLLKYIHAKVETFSTCGIYNMRQFLEFCGETAKQVKNKEEDVEKSVQPALDESFRESCIQLFSSHPFPSYKFHSSSIHSYICFFSFELTSAQQKERLGALNPVHQTNLYIHGLYDTHTRSTHTHIRSWGR